MRHIRDLMVSPSSPVREAIRRIDHGEMRIALVVDEEHRLIGTVTDGDVRRGLLRGVNLDDPTECVMNGSPTSAGETVGRDEILCLMREKQVQQIPIIDPVGRVVRLETHDDWLTPAITDTWVVLMVGGLGTRLRPHTDDVPKPLVKIGGKPLLETIIQNMARQGFRRFFLSVNYKAEMFETHFEDGGQWEIEIDYLREDEKLGTAGALRLLPERVPGPIIVMNGDLLTSVDFRHLLEFHRTHLADATMCVRDYSFEVPYGVATIDESRLVAISEKPKHHFFVNAGIYVLAPSALELLPVEGAYDMPQLLEALIDARRQTMVFPIREYWLDIGQLTDLEQARADFPRVFG